MDSGEESRYSIEAAVLDGAAGAYSSVSNVQFFIDGTNAGQLATFPFRLTLSNPALGAHLLSARLNDNSGTTLDSAPVNINVTRELVSTTMMC